MVFFRRLHIFCVFLLSMVSLSAPAQVNRSADVKANRAFIYHGKIVRPDGSVPTGSIPISLKIYSPDPALCLLWAEAQTVDVKLGGFSVELGHTVNRLPGSAGGAALDFKQAFINNPGLTISSAQCASGNTYTPGSADDRLLSAAFTDNGSVIEIVGLPIKSVPFAMQAEEIGGYGLANLAKISGAGSAVVYTPSEVLTLKDMLGGDVFFDMKSRAVKNVLNPSDPQDAATKSWVESHVASSMSGGGLGTVVNVSAAGAPLSVSNGTSSPMISIAQANTTTAGYLSAADWNTFNGKQPAGSYLNAAVTADFVYVGTGASSTARYLRIGDIHANSGGNPSFLGAAGACSAGTSLQYNSVTDRLECAVYTLATNAVATATITDKAVTLAKLQDIATGSLLGRSTTGTGIPEVITVGSGLSLSGGTLTTTGSSGITSVGTITSGTWNGSTIPVAYGGTGTTTGSITAAAGNGLTFTAGSGGNYNVRLTPSGTGSTLLDGNVGVGTTSPTTRLDIRGSTVSGSSLIAAAIDENTSIAARRTSDGYLTPVIGTSGADGSRNIHIGSFSGDQGTGFINLNVGGAERVHVSATGNVGIGTSSPGQLLHVVGNAQFTPTGSAGLLIDAYSDEAISKTRLFSNGAIYIQSNSTGSGKAGVTIAKPAGSGADETTILKIDSRNQATDTTPVLDVVSLSQSLLRVQENGNVGIGTSSPASRLEVAGTITATGFSGPMTSSIVGVGAGSSGSPSMAFSGDANTGFYNTSSNDTISVAAGGAKIFDLSASGIVSPTTGGAAITTANGTAAAPTYGFAGDAGTGWFRPAASMMAGATSGVERMRIDSAGNVGIGTTSPAALVDMTNGISSTRFDGKAISYHQSGAANPRWTIGSQTVGTSAGLAFGHEAWGTLAAGGVALSNPSARNLAFSTSNGTALTERMRIDSVGNVGVGTISPSSIVDAVGVLTAGSTASTDGTTILRSRYGTNETLNMIGTELSTGNTILGYGVTPSTSAVGAFNSGSDNANLPRAAMTVGSTGFTFRTGSPQTVAIGSSVTMAPVMMITTAGNVGFGTTSPAEKLEVAGGKIKAPEFCIGAACITAWPSGGGGTITEVTVAGGGLSIANGTSTPQITLAQANTTTAGYLSSADWNTFNGKQAAGSYLTTALATNQVLMGDGSNVAQAGFFGLGQLRNNLGNAQFPSACGAHQTLTWLAITDVLACTNVNNLNADKITAGTIASARLGSGTADGTTYLRGDATWATLPPGADNLGNHAATANLNLATFKLVGNGGSEGIAIDANGNVGIGTTSPGLQPSAGRTYLTVSGPSGAGALEFATTSADASGSRLGNINFVDINSTDSSKISAAIYASLAGTTANNRGSRLYFTTKPDGATAPSSRMIVTENGDIGVGISLPFARFHVQGNGTGTALATTGSSDPTVNFRSSRGAYGIDLGNLDSGIGYIQARAFTNFATNRDLLLQPNGGNIGIGTLDPSHKLHIQGADSSPDFVLENTDSSAAQYPMASVKNFRGATDTAGYPVFQFVNSRGTKVSQVAVEAGDYLGSIQFLGSDSATAGSTNRGAQISAIATENYSTSTGATALIFNTTPMTQVDSASYERMRIAANGFVGIGTTSPGSRLSVLSSNVAQGAGGILRVQSSDAALVDKGSAISLRGNAFSTNTNFVELAGRSENGLASDRGYFAISTNGTGGVLEKVRISSDGNVGIGTASPNAKLDVIGNGVLRSTETYLEMTPSTSSDTLGYAALQAWDNVATAGARPLVLQNAGGNVGVGTTSPSHILDVQKAQAGYTYISVDNGASSAAGVGEGIRFAEAGSDAAVIRRERDGTGTFNIIANGGPVNISTGASFAAATPKLTVTNGGNVGIGTTSPSYKLHVVGTAGLSTGTAWTNASDARLKDVHGSYEYGLQEILKLRPVRYHYKKGNPLELPSDHAMTGFVAQEVRSVIPDAVHERADGYLELNVDPIHWANVNATKELHGMCKAIESRVDALERENRSIASENARIGAENAALKSENSVIRAYLCAKDPAAPFCR